MAKAKRKKEPLVVKIDRDVMVWLNDICELANIDLDTVVSVILAIGVIAGGRKAKKPAKIK